LGKAWPALQIHVPGCDPDLQDLVLAELDDFRPAAIQDSDDTSPLRVFFTAADSRDAAARALGVAFGSYVFVESIDVPDEDWAARSQAQLKAVTIGRLVVAPPWDEAATHQKRGQTPFLVLIQPSTGFGTGHHPTTRLVLRALQTLPLDGRTLLDIGCGSGVLAIAAIKLGARAAVAVDIDPDALENARENVGLNEVAGRVHLELADFREMSAQADVVTANLTSALLERFAEPLADLVVPGGSLLVSGFTRSDETVTRTLAQFLTLQHVDAEEEWVCGTFVKQG
jgi:ribosomal protein L11 methyltransferase